MDVSDMSVGNIVVIVVGRRTMFSSLQGVREFNLYSYGSQREGHLH
jgi:hypothetical protein